MHLPFKILMITGALITAGLAAAAPAVADGTADNGNIELRLQ